MSALALEDGFPAPLKSHPAQVVHRSSGELLRAPLRIKVLHSEKNPSIGIGGATLGHGKCQCMPKMQMTCGCGSEATEIFHIGDETPIFGISG
jgi:hypothetical protein